VGVLRDGQLLQLAPPAELLRHPADEYVKRLMDSGLALVADVQALLRQEAG
jgi:ABC-type proline/glycine betaine transport system ATPase subunit